VLVVSEASHKAQIWEFVQRVLWFGPETKHYCPGMKIKIHNICDKLFCVVDCNLNTTSLFPCTMSSSSLHAALIQSTTYIGEDVSLSNGLFGVNGIVLMTKLLQTT
jgi:hypothetical protein